MLNVFAPSPPVPQVSIAPAGASGTPDRELAHGLGRADDLVDRLAARAQRGEQRGDLHVGERAGHDLAHQRAHLGARERLAAHGALEHGRHHAAFRPASRASRRKFASRSLPWTVRIDSGWNCTPNTGCARVAHAHDLAVLGLGGDDERSSATPSRATASEW